jgi:hypothetical protein
MKEPWKTELYFTKGVGIPTTRKKKDRVLVGSSFETDWDNLISPTAIEW